MDEKQIDITEAVMALSEHRKMIAYDRAWAKMGYVDLGDDPTENEEFISHFEKELIDMVAGDTMESLVNKGLIEAHVRPQGDLEYTLTEAGAAVFEAQNDGIDS